MTSILSPPLEPHCIPESKLLVTASILFHSCIPNYLSLISTTLGLVSIASWLFAQIPQIVKNIKRKSVDGLSWGFLMMWLMGDICNLTGAILLDQMWFQQIIAAYYVFVDTVLVSQLIWYGLANRVTVLEKVLVDQIEGVSIGGNSSSGDENEDSMQPPVDTDLKRKRIADVEQRQESAARRGKIPSIAHTILITISLLGALAGALPVDESRVLGILPLGGVPNRFLSDEIIEAIGMIVGWISTLLYLCSRLPQLILNAKRRSTEGLSIALFIAAFSGNFFYSASLLTNPLGWHDYGRYGGGGVAGPEGSNATEWWGRSLPFFLGAFGVLTMDAAVGVQFRVWGAVAGKGEVELDSHGERGGLLAVRRETDGYGSVESISSGGRVELGPVG